MDGQLGSTWYPVCSLTDIVPDTGVAALIAGEQIAVFRFAGNDAVYAISNYDPNSHAAVLSRGMVGNLGERLVVASPIYKQHFDLATGECLEAPENSVRAYPVRLRDGQIEIAA